MQKERALSEIVSTILIIAMVLFMAIVVYAMFFGALPFQQKTVLVSADIKSQTVSGKNLITVFHKAGDEFALNSSSGSLHELSIIVENRTNSTRAMPVPGLNRVKPGTILFVYYNASKNLYRVTTEASILKAEAQNVTACPLMIRLVDETSHTLISSWNATCIPLPEAVSAQTDTLGTTITITFNKAMANPAGKQSQFRYRVNGGTLQTFSSAALDADPTKINLRTSGTAIVYGNTVTVSYTAGTITSADSMALASFANMPVTNMRGGPPYVTGAETNGTVITITFNKAMANPAGRQGQFRYKVNGGPDQAFSSATLDADPTKINLRTSYSLITYGDTVTVNYTRGNVLAADTGVLASFAGQPVTNRMAAPPVFGSAATNTAGTMITITFNKPMANPSGKQGQFRYKVNGGADQAFSTAALNADPTKIDLTTTSPTAITSGSIVTVNYTKGTILAADNGILASFAAQPVTNNKGSPPTFSSAATNTAGTMITITFSKPMANPVGRQGQFRYKVNGGADQTFSSAALNADPTKIDLITSSSTAITGGSVITVNYTRGTVLAADTGVLASFAAQPVTNNKASPPTVVSAATNTAGTVITVAFNKAMADPSGKQGRFQYQINGGAVQAFNAATLNADSTKIDLTTTSATAITSGSTITLRYNAGTTPATMVSAADTGVLAGFTGQPVTNNKASPPTVVSAATNTAGTVITVAFNKAMADPSGKQSRFQYQINGGTVQAFSAATLNSDPTKIDLTTSGTPITSGRTITLRHNAGTTAATMVFAADTGVLAGFTGLTVTNNKTP